MKICFDLQEADLRVGMAHANEVLVRARPHRALDLAVNVVVWMCVGLVVAIALDAYERAGPAVLYAAGLGVLAIAVGVGYLHYRHRRYVRFMVGLYAPFPVPQCVTLGETDLEFESRSVRARYPWSAVRAVRDAPAHVVVLLRPVGALAIPKRAFAGAQDSERFVAAVAAALEGQPG